MRVRAWMDTLKVASGCIAGAGCSHSRASSCSRQYRCPRQSPHAAPLPTSSVCRRATAAAAQTAGGQQNPWCPVNARQLASYIPSCGNAELAELADTMDTLAAQLQRGYDDGEEGWNNITARLLLQARFRLPSCPPSTRPGRWCGRLPQRRLPSPGRGHRGGAAAGGLRVVRMNKWSIKESAVQTSWTTLYRPFASNMWLASQGKPHSIG